MESPFKKYCQSCGDTQAYTTKVELNRATKNNTICRLCHAKKAKAHKGGYKEISISWYDEKKRKAIARKKQWEIDIKYVWTIYVRQGRVCALSGLPLDFNKDSAQAMVSIDRIKNDKGYIKRNVQLLHKDVNFMKYVYEQKYFIEMCKLIAEKHNS